MTGKNLRLNRILAEAEHSTVREMWQFRRGLKQPLLECAAKVALGAVLRPAPVRNHIRTKINADENLPGYSYIGGGYQQRAYKCGREVIKMLDSVTDYAGLSLEEIAAKLQGYSDTCEQALGGQAIEWTPTQFDVINLPVSGGRKIITRQPLVDDGNLYFDMAGLAQDPGVPAGTKEEFADGVDHVYQSTGLYIDVRGSGNIARRPGRYAVIDTIPVDALGQTYCLEEGLTIGEDIRRQLEIVRAA